jgi:hypothetical protein
MKKLVKACILALFLFIILNFIYCNLNEEAFNYELSFIFTIPYIFSMKSYPMPLGFVIILSFSLGIIFFAALQALPSFFRTGAVKVRDKKIKVLEKELEAVRHSPTHESDDAKPIDTLPPIE